MQVVSNSTPLIFLAKIGKLSLLERIFEVVLIPNKVFFEVVVEGKEKGYNDAFLVEEFIERGVIIKKKVEIEKLNKMPIGRGEIETIELALREEIKSLSKRLEGVRTSKLFSKENCLTCVDESLSPLPRGESC